MFTSTFNARDRKFAICNRIRARIGNISGSRPIEASVDFPAIDIRQKPNGVFLVDETQGIEKGSCEARNIQQQLVARSIFGY